MANLAGQTLGRYFLIERLGQGGMATVYKAFDTRLERIVAIKVIRREVISQDMLATLLKRFERETKALAQLDHPNIIKVHDSGEHDGVPYLVMQYIDGGSIEPEPGHPMPYRDAARLLLPIARALDYAHHRNLVHRDVKPANILITQDGMPMLSDFGIAKLLEAHETAALTGTSVGIGTPEYMAPEQATGSSIDRRADIYSLGVVLYQLVVGRKPFEADTPLAVILKHVTDPLPRPKDFIPDLPDEVENILFKALAKRPADRYQDMGAFAAALEKLLAPAPVVEKAVAPPTQQSQTAATLIESVNPPSQPVAAQGVAEQTSTSQPVQQKLPPSTKPPVSRPVTPQARPASKAQIAAQRAAAQPADSSRKVWIVGGVTALLAIICLIGAIITLAQLGYLGGAPAVANVPATATETGVPPISSITFTPTTGGSTEVTQPTAEIPTITATLTPIPSATPEVISTPLPTSASIPTSAKIEPVTEGTPLPKVRATISSDTAKDVQQLARWGKGDIHDAVYSPDGKTIAVASSLGIYLIDASSLNEIRWIPTDAYIVHVVFSPDGSHMAAGGNNNLAYVFNVSDGKDELTLSGHTSYIMGIAYSPDGKTIVTGSYDRTVRVWDASNGLLLRTLTGASGAIDCVAFSPDGKLVAGGGDSSDKQVHIWQASDGTLVKTLTGYKDFIYNLAFSPDGKFLATTTYQENVIKLWQMSDWSLKELQGHNSGINMVKFSPDGSLLASSAYDNTVKLWSMPDGAPLRTLHTFDYGANAINFSPDGSSMVVTSYDSSMSILKVADGAVLKSMARSIPRVEGVTLSPDGKILAAAYGQSDKKIHLLQTADGTDLNSLAGHKFGVYRVAYSPDGTLLASSGSDGTVIIWQMPGGTILKTLTGFNGLVYALTFSPDGKTLATSGGYPDKDIKLWSLPDGSLIRQLTGFKDTVYALAFSPDCSVLASSGAWNDKTVKLWRVSDGILLKSMDFSAYVDSLAFSPDGRILAIGITNNSQVQLYQTTDWLLLKTLSGHSNGITALAFSPDGKMLASGSYDASIILWQTSDWSSLARLTGHTNYILGLAFMPDNSALVSASFDVTIRFWGVP